MLSDRHNTVLATLITVLALGFSMPCMAGGARHIARFQDVGVPVHAVNKIHIYYVAIQDQGHTRPEIAKLKQRSSAKLTIRCGSRCSESVPRIVDTVMNAKKVADCPIYEVEFIVGLGESVNIAVMRDRRSFWYEGMCFQFQSDSTGKMLYGIFGGLWD